ncbi:(2Fe-2S)-binding protein [bacterium]|nr:(2Fe-2S)-binding protein [bacterium]
MELKLNINDKLHVLDIEPGDLLVDVLRKSGYKSVKIGCREGTCGTCTILLNGNAVNSCLVFAADCEGASIHSVESLGTMAEPHPLQEAFVKHGATQCGYCNPGSLLSAKALLNEKPDPTEEEVKEALDGNLCRCTGYVKRIEAILAASKKMRS